MAGSPQHITLAANTVATVTFDTRFAKVVVLNRDGAAEIYFRVDGNSPTVEGTLSEVIPATVGAFEVVATSANPTVVKLISAGTPKVSVKGL